MRVVVAGSHGLIGSALLPELRRAGHLVERLMRPGSAEAGIAWDPAAGAIDAAALEGADAVINLAGRNIGSRRWNEAEKALVAGSRVGVTRLLSEAVAGLARPPRALLNASAVGFYGDRGDRHLTEADGPGEGFLAALTRRWEEATAPAIAAGVRVVHLRSGVVLSREGGTLSRLLAPFGPRWLSPYRWGLGGWVGHGRQVMSWISIEDEVGAIIHLLGSDLSGPVNLTSPSPVSNKAFMKAVGRALGRPVLVPIPRLVIEMVLGKELADALLFQSQAAFPARLLGDGFGFSHPEVEPALRRALGG